MFYDVLKYAVVFAGDIVIIPKMIKGLGIKFALEFVYKFTFLVQGEILHGPLWVLMDLIILSMEKRAAS